MLTGLRLPRTVWLTAASYVATVLVAQSALATTALQALRFSPDVTISLGGTDVDPNRVAEDDLDGEVSVVGDATVALPANLIGYHEREEVLLLSFDIDVTLDDVTARPGDVVAFDGASHVIIFDSLAMGIPRGVLVDAISETGSDLLLSFDTHVQLSGISVGPEDLVRYDGDGFSRIFDGSEAGIAPGRNLDAAHYLEANGHLLLSFDGSGTLNGVTFDDEDVLEYDPGPGAWELAYDGSERSSGMSAANLDAVYATAELIDTPTPTPTGTGSAPPTPTPTGSTPRTSTPTATGTGPPPSTPTATEPPVSTATATGSPQPASTATATAGCLGDCNGDGSVTIDELITGVNIALGSRPIDDCTPLDGNQDGVVTIDELITAVNNAQDRCG